MVHVQKLPRVSGLWGKGWKVEDDFMAAHDWSNFVS